MLNKHDIEILRPLIMEYAEIAALPIHNEKRELWRNHNELRDSRPMILIDQVCWNEFNENGCLDALCEDPYWNYVEGELRRKLYSWKHMPVDMVFNPYLDIPKPVTNTGWGIEKKDTLLSEDETSDVYSHAYENILDTEEDLEKIKMPEPVLHVEKYKELKEEADVLFEGIIPYQFCGQIMHLGLWDKISQWKGVTSCYMDLMERPEFLHAIMEKLTQGILHQIEVTNRLGVYDITGNITHCSQTFTDTLPKKDADPNFGTTENGWAFGLAQLFTAVSPDVTEEFEVPYMNRIFPHFGAIYYGCCERLDDRLDVIAKLKNIRKISCSPWSHKEHFAEVMPDWCNMSVKPNPALLSPATFDEDAIRHDLRESMDAARKYNRHVELIQKDISTVHYEPQRLWRWAEIAMEEAQRYC